MRRLLFALFCCGFLAPAAVSATGTAEVKEVKQKIHDRAPVIRDLLRRGVVGESATGFLAVRGTLTDEEKRNVEAANRDRKTIYADLARRQKLSPEEVGRREAKRIFGAVKRGTWLLDENGCWSCK